MKFLSFFYRARKSVLLILPFLMLGSYAIHEAVATSRGITGQSRIGCGGYGCHGSQSSKTVISISTASAQIQAGRTYIFRLSVTNPAEHAAGCDISVDNGATLKTDSTGLWLDYSSGELTHTMPNPFGNAYGKAGDSAVWLFKYTAPKTVGMTRIYVASNAVNFNGNADAGDHWNLAVDTLTVVASGVATEASPTTDINVFPNPSRTGHFTIVSPEMAGRASIAVTDPVGKAVLQENLTLGNESSLDLSSLPNGTYFLSIRTRNGQSFIRRIVIDR